MRFETCGSWPSSNTPGRWDSARHLEVVPDTNTTAAMWDTLVSRGREAAGLIFCLTGTAVRRWHPSQAGPYLPSPPVRGSTPQIVFRSQVGAGEMFATPGRDFAATKRKEHQCAAEDEAGCWPEPWR